MSIPLVWQPHAPALAIAALAIAAVVWVFMLTRVLRHRWDARETWWLLAPKCAVLALLLVALLDPAFEHEDASGASRSLLVLIDQSSSMDVKDGAGGASRRERAERIAQTLRPPKGVTMTTRWFDSALHDQPSASAAAPVSGERGTDLGACLQAAAREAAAGNCVGVVVVSDGGDESIATEGMPSAPISAIGIGADPALWKDLAIADLQAPAIVERDIDFEISADLAATGDEAFLGGLSAVPAVLELRVRAPDPSKGADNDPGAGTWREVERKNLDLRHGRARASFRLKASDPGSARYRVGVAAIPGELSILNNRREAAVDVQERALHVLYFTRSIGLDFKSMRSELARDSGISFTALYRTVSGRLSSSGGERFTVQGDRIAGDDDLGAGFPKEAKALARYDCVVLGSFAANSWNETEQRLLADYVANGGSAVFLGGEESFGAGGYAASPLAPLMPWQLSDGEPAMARGDFPVNVPPAAAASAVVQGIGELLGQAAAVASLNQPGPLRGGATALMQASSGNTTVALVAAQPYGKGKVIGIASDTLWRLARSGRSGDSAYGLLWRQAVRWLADRGEGGRVLRVSWDKARYRPGEIAQATVRVTAPGAKVRLSASLELGATRSDLTVSPAAGQADAWTVSAPFGARGDYRVRIVAYQADATLESYEKALEVAPLLPEGARLARDDAGLKQLAEAHGGVYAGEEATGAIEPWIASLARARGVVAAKSLVFSTPGWLILLLTALVLEWTIRRRRNLL